MGAQKKTGLLPVVRKLHDNYWEFDFPESYNEEKALEEFYNSV